jgi:hypothetical protein
VCSVGPVKYLSSLAVDRKGDLLAAAGVDHGTRSGKNVQSTVTILKGPGLCGPELGSITDPYGGRPTDVASRDAQSGKIVVGNDYGDGDRSKRRRGGVTVCTLSGGCTANFLTPKIRNVFAVALAPNGDCWASGTEPNGYEELAYFANCRGRGVIATGFQEFPYGLDIDDHGNLVVISAYGYGRSALYIYSGCNPTCSLVGGPFQLEGFVSYGHLDASSKHLVVADNQNSRLDVYSYSTKGIRFEYSITAGLSPSANVTGAAFSPSSKE